ncbi:MAG: PIN domain nuclease [Calditrichaeota bacterium]|nr:PIN domain nuclease [Calditrichota bacterium]
MIHDGILIDTSIWIASFRMPGFENLKEEFQGIIRSGRAKTSHIIILELVQGTKTEEEKDHLRSLLESLEILDIEPKVWNRAYELSFKLRRKGLTIPTVDIIIACLAIEYKCQLLHYDQHYSKISDHFSELKIYSLKNINS